MIGRGAEEKESGGWRIGSVSWSWVRAVQRMGDKNPWGWLTIGFSRAVTMVVAIRTWLHGGDGSLGFAGEETLMCVW